MIGRNASIGMTYRPSVQCLVHLLWRPEEGRTWRIVGMTGKEMGKILRHEGYEMHLLRCSRRWCEVLNTRWRERSAKHVGVGLGTH